MKHKWQIKYEKYENLPCLCGISSLEGFESDCLAVCSGWVVVCARKRVNMSGRIGITYLLDKSRGLILTARSSNVNNKTFGSLPVNRIVFEV